MSAFWARSGSLATIRSLHGSKKWIIRDGVSGISSSGAGAPTARGLAKSRGLRIAWNLATGRCAMIWAMSTETPAVETDQAAREATGAHPYGRYLEEFEVGAVYKHWPAKTVTEADDHLFCLITMNHHPLHINDVYAGQSQQGRNVVVGPLVYSLALGMSVSDVSGKAIANLATEELKHPAPVFHGDTLFCESEVLEVKESRSKSDRGTVRVHTRVLNQDGVLVAEFKRLVLVPRREAGGDEGGAGRRRAPSPDLLSSVTYDVEPQARARRGGGAVALARARPRATVVVLRAGGAQVTKVAPHGATPVSPLSSVGSAIVSLFWIAMLGVDAVVCGRSSPASR